MLTHLARNADGLSTCSLARAPATTTPMYPSQAGRDADIEAGADRPRRRPAATSDSAERLLGALRRPPDEALSRAVVPGRRRRRRFGWEVPLMRTREVVLHHVDLDAGYTRPDWSDGLRCTARSTSWRRSSAPSATCRSAGWRPATGPVRGRSPPTGRADGPDARPAGLAHRPVQPATVCSLDTGDPLPIAPTWG